MHLTERILMSSTNQGNRERLWIIDCDPGCDDAIALGLAAQKLDNAVILTVAGNVGVELTTWNACRVMAACGKRWPVYRGCGRSLSGEAVPAASVHGRDGLGDIPNNMLPGIRAPEKTSAIEFLLKCMKEGTQFVLVCTGPLTNLATALNLMSSLEQSTFWSNCKYCVVMGGAFDVPGNITEAAEFNVHFDPVALHMVLESWREASQIVTDLKPIHFVPLDVTETVGIPLPPKSENGVLPRTAFFRAALRKYGMFHAWFCRRPREARGFGVKKGATRFGIKEFSEERFLNDRMAGNNGLAALAPFCFLHDPLAFWVALQLVNGKDTPTFWATCQISVDTFPGLGRGRICQHRQRDPRDTPSRLSPMGTRVMWLRPGPFSPMRNPFVNDVKSFLELPLDEPQAKSS